MILIEFRHQTVTTRRARTQRFTRAAKSTQVSNTLMMAWIQYFELLMVSSGADPDSRTTNIYNRKQVMMQLHTCECIVQSDTVFLLDIFANLYNALIAILDKNILCLRQELIMNLSDIPPCKLSFRTI